MCPKTAPKLAKSNKRAETRPMKQACFELARISFTLLPFWGMTKCLQSEVKTWIRLSAGGLGSTVTPIWTVCLCNRWWWWTQSFLPGMGTLTRSQAWVNCERRLQSSILNNFCEQAFSLKQSLLFVLRISDVYNVFWSYLPPPPPLNPQHLSPDLTSIYSLSFNPWV